VKSIIVIGDGMSDRPIEKLGGKTPLQVARKPHIDRIAREGRMGRLRTVGETGPADSAVAANWQSINQRQTEIASCSASACEPSRDAPRPTAWLMDRLPSRREMKVNSGTPTR